jgi:hypothetical protein
LALDYETFIVLFIWREHYYHYRGRPVQSIGEKSVADNDDLLKQFAEFMEAKNAEKESEGPEPEVEIWDKEGNGARVPRSAAKGFLNKFGIDVDPDPPASDDSGSNSDGKRSKSPAKSAPTGTTKTSEGQSVTRYFAKRPAGK